MLMGAQDRKSGSMDGGLPRKRIESSIYLEDFPRWIKVCTTARYQHEILILGILCQVAPAPARLFKPQVLLFTSNRLRTNRPGTSWPSLIYNYVDSRRSPPASSDLQILNLTVSTSCRTKQDFRVVWSKLPPLAPPISAFYLQPCQAPHRLTSPCH